jgi:ribonuclease HII
MGRRPNLKFEWARWQDGVELVAGVDEVGRGPLAGPVAAGAVILPANVRAAGRFHWLKGVNDSKQLTALQREQLVDNILEYSLASAVAFVPVEHIDRIGIAEASRQAMLAAIGDLGVRPGHLLIDGFGIKACSVPQTAIIDGDALSLSIACASIIAKVARDRVMQERDVDYPAYGFASNKGYATPTHMRAIRTLGPCALHRRSFSPVREMVAATV